jgi:hypothetical protein
MRSAAHEAVRQVRLEQVKEAHIASMQVGEMRQVVVRRFRLTLSNPR